MNTELTNKQIDAAWESAPDRQGYARGRSRYDIAHAVIAADRAARIGEFPALPEPDHATVSPWDKDATQMVFFTADQMRAYAAQAVEAGRAARGVPEGWRLVPAEPTQEMYQSVIHNGYYHDDPAKVRSVLRSEYQDMLAAAPQPAAQPEPTLTTCNCRWDGDVQVQQCTLHESHIAAIRDWAERAKTAEKRLAETSPHQFCIIDTAPAERRLSR